jgi:hypothetical protein
MSRIEEELKLEKIHQARNNRYQEYQAYLENFEKESASDNVGEMRGKQFKKLSSETGLSFLFRK